MRLSRGKSIVGAVCGLGGLAFLLSARTVPPRAPQAATPAPQEITLEVDPAQSKVYYTVDSTLHTVHGTFELRKGSLIHFDTASGKASGEISVYATSGESGNSARDVRMHKEILETQKYPDIIFRPRQIEGRAAASGPSDVKLHGVMLLHGGEYELVALVHVELAADHWQGTAQFDVPYVQWGIKDPSNWLLKVKPVVHVELNMVGTERVMDQK